MRVKGYEWLRKEEEGDRRDQEGRRGVRSVGKEREWVEGGRRKRRGIEGVGKKGEGR